MKLWKNFGGEPYLINPVLRVLNPRGERKTKMRLARDSKGRFLKRGHRANPGHHKKHRHHQKNTPLALANRRKPRRNPNGGAERGMNLFGVTLPPLKSMAEVSAGFVGPPFLEGFIIRSLPADTQRQILTPKSWQGYLLKFATVLGITWGATKFLGREDGKRVAMGGGAYIGVTAWNDFVVPMLTAGSTPAGAPAPSGTGYYYPRAARGMGAQPMLDRYGQSAPNSRMMTAVPERLRPSGRF